MDICFHNANEYFNGWAIHDFLDYMSSKFKSRKTVWSLLDPQNDNVIDEANQRIYRMCFSSQFYFICAMVDTGMIMCILGLNTMLIFTNYNPFDDKALSLVISFVIILCYWTEKLTLKLGKWLKIWKIEKQDEVNNMEEDKTESKLDNLIDLFHQLHQNQSEAKIVPDIRNWNQVEIIRADDELIRRELNSERVTDEHVRDQFLNINRNWLQDNLETILSPESLIENRGLILTTFNTMFGPLPISEEPRHFLTLDSRPSVVIPSSLPYIAKKWLIKARRNRDLMAQAYPIIVSKREERCLYCSTRFGLQSELLESVEELFNRFKDSENDDSDA